MFDIGWTELLLVGIVALIVVGPKDLPGMFRTLGRFTGKMKGMAREFQRAMSDAADEAGVKDMAKDLKDATSARNMGLDKLDAAASKFEKWTPGKSARGPETEKLSEERAEAKRKVQEATAKKGLEMQAEAAAKAEAAAAPKPAAKPKAAAKPKVAAKPAAAAKPEAAAKPKVAAKPAAAKKAPVKRAAKPKVAGESKT